jgi:hypothetical protein
MSGEGSVTGGGYVYGKGLGGGRVCERVRGGGVGDRESPSRLTNTLPSDGPLM